MKLLDAKNLADQLRGRGGPAFTEAQRLEAIRLLERTNRGQKTQRAWDRLDARLKALKEAKGA